MSTPKVTIAQLLDAIFKDDVNQMQACIQANPTLLTQSGQGKTQLLYRDGTRGPVETTHAVTPLLYALEQEKYECALALLATAKNGAEYLNTPNDCGHTPLYMLMMMGPKKPKDMTQTFFAERFETMLRFLKEKASLAQKVLNAPDGTEDKRTPLALAFRYTDGSLEMARHKMRICQANGIDSYKGRLFWDDAPMGTQWLAHYQLLQTSLKLTGEQIESDLLAKNELGQNALESSVRNQKLDFMDYCIATVPMGVWQQRGKTDFNELFQRVIGAELSDNSVKIVEKLLSLGAKPQKKFIDRVSGIRTAKPGWLQKKQLEVLEKISTLVTQSNPTEKKTRSEQSNTEISTEKEPKTAPWKALGLTEEEYKDALKLARSHDQRRRL